MKKIGYTAEGLSDKSRKLVISNEEKKIRFIIPKTADVPTYVEYGAADIGIVGRDTILEEGRKVYEMLDLGFGRCRMCVCGPASAASLLTGRSQIRVATKYPNITRKHFESKGMDVDIIKIEGSVELAPLLELADGIVDIVETGTTLKENGLEIIEDNICPISARLIVNTVSMKMRQSEIENFVTLVEKNL